MSQYLLSLLIEEQGDNAFVIADNSLAKSILSWTPKEI